jgi:OPA family glycerol-3-phosphate transporter-like MFS transporter
MCRYNFRWASPDIQKEFQFSYLQITQILGAWSWAYGVGQLVNGLFTDRIGGKAAMLCGAAGTILVNLAFGAASFSGTFGTFALIWLLNGYVQAFGAPGMVKTNAAWFHKTERGTFAGIFGFMIQLGQLSINKLAPLLLGGGVVLIWSFPALHWRWLFWIPPIFCAFAAVLLALLVKPTPEAAGYPGVMPESDGIQVAVPMREAFLTIVRHPLVWFYALAYACTGAVRHGADHLAVLYFVNELGLTRDMPAVRWTLQIMPLVAVLGSFGAGIFSDKLFRGRRAPVAMSLYLLETVVILCAVFFVVMLGMKGVFLSCLFLVLISLTSNSTHSLVGTAAPMDIGGPRMAGFAAGVIDSFQYFGSGIALPLMGWLLDKYGWKTWFPSMAAFGLLGAFAMLGVMRRQKQGHRD